MAVTFKIAKLFTKTLNSTGEETGRVPMLFRTIASLVYRTDGTTVESALTALETNDTKSKVYTDLATYTAEYNAGTVGAEVVAIITGE